MDTRGRWIRRGAVVGLLLVGVAAGCRQQDIREKTIRIPQCKNQECAKRIETALRNTEGVLPVPDAVVFSGQAVTVRYDSMRVALKNLEGSIAEAGFDANDTPADPATRAALPETCR